MFYGKSDSFPTKSDQFVRVTDVPSKIVNFGVSNHMTVYLQHELMTTKLIFTTTDFDGHK